MNFTSNGVGRKNGFRFEIRYSRYLGGQEQENKWYLYCSRPIGKQIHNEGTYTERSLRFPTREAAQAYCERIANGEVSLAELKANEDKAWSDHESKELDAAKKKVDGFFDRLKELGVDPVLVPDILKAYSDMRHGGNGKVTEVFENQLRFLKEQAPVQQQSSQQTLGDFLKHYQKDVDVCLVDSDTGEHLLPAIVYISDEELLWDEYGYDDWEKWVLSLPLDHTINNQGCVLAVVNTTFNWDQTCFLLGQNEFESSHWSQLYIRSSWACADFKDRLAYLSVGKSFEVPFDGNSMDGEDPECRKKLISMLETSNHVFIAPFPDSELSFFAYSYYFNNSGKLILGEDVDIKLTEPGKGLVSSLDGKVAWAGYMARQAQPEAQSAPSKKIEVHQDR